MYGQGNYPPQHGQGSHTPPPPFTQRPVTPHFQHRPPSVIPSSGYSGPFQFQQPPPPPAQHGLPIQNAPHSYHLPPGPSQAHVSNGAPQSYPPVQSTMWGRDAQRPPPPPHPPLAPLPPGPNRSEMFRPSIPHRGFAYTPQSTNQLPPPPPPTSSFFTPAPLFSTGPSPPPPPLPHPLPPSSPPPVPPSPPPPIPPSAFGALTSTALGTASDLPHILKLDSPSETIGSYSADKVTHASEIMVGTAMAVDSNNLTDRAGTEVGSPALKDLDSGEYRDLDLPPPPPKPAEDVVKKIEDMCHSIAKNGLGFECITRQKESGNPEFRFLFGGEVGSEAAVAHEYFKWARKKCLLQRKKSNAAPKLPNTSTLTRTSSMEADVSPSVSDMEMEDDFVQPDEVHYESVSSPEDRGYREQLCAPQDDIECSPPEDNASRFFQLDEEEKATGPILSHQNDQLTHGNAFLGVDSLNTSPYRAVKPMESSYVGVSSSSSLEDPNPVKSADELNKGPSPFRLLQDYASDDSSEHDDMPPLEDVIPVTVLPSNTGSNASLHGDVQSNFQAGLGSMNLPRPELAFEKSSEPVEARSLPTSPSKDQELLLMSQCTAAEANITSTYTVKAEIFVEGNKENQECNESVISPGALGVKDVLQVVEEASPEKRNAKFQKEDVQHTSTHQKVDEFGRLVRDVASDSDSDDSYRIRRHSKRGRSRSRSPHDRRSRWSPQSRREKRSGSRSWSPQKRRSRSRSPSYRRGGESGVEAVRRDKCFDFLRGRCYRGASCRFMHQEMDKSAGAKYNRNTQTYRHEETEKNPRRRSNHMHDLPGSSAVCVKNATMDQDDKSLVADFLKSERLSGTNATVLESTEMEEILESTNKLRGIEHCREKEETEDPVIDRSQANTSVPIITSTTSEDQIEMSKPDLNRNASINPNQGAHLELRVAPTSLPQSTSIPPPPLLEERFQPSSHYPYQAQSQMQPLHYPTPPNTWPLPPPPTLPTPLQQQFGNNFIAPNVIQGVPPLPFQQSQFSARNDYRMFQQHSYPAPSSQTEDLQSKPLSMNNAVNQIYGGTSLHPSHLSSFPMPSLGHSATYIQQQQPQYSLQQPSSDGLRFGAYANISAPFGGSKITHHYNPYASTFDQPFDSKINSNVLNQGKDLPNVNPVISPTKIPQTAELPKSGSNQYDPLFDSIEPPSSSIKKIDEGQGLESALRLSSSRTPLDVGESYRQKEAETAATGTPTKSNAEFGETADAEVGEVESGRSSNPHDGGPTALGEIEIEQVKTPGKDKKSKDSRSMKLFKSSIAEYVKEVLKPHWRQGGMSKEAFKIIVKKTIDKVCGATKSHHIPKSQEKINRYIDSSERKLNKLVMGYVDKYAKI